MNTTNQTPDYIVKWNKENPRLQWKNLSNDERTLIRLKAENEAASIKKWADKYAARSFAGFKTTH